MVNETLVSSASDINPYELSILNTPCGKFLPEIKSRNAYVGARD